MIIENSTDLKMLQSMQKAIDSQIARLVEEGQIGQIGQIDFGDLPLEKLKVDTRIEELLKGEKK